MANRVPFYDDDEKRTSRIDALGIGVIFEDTSKEYKHTLLGILVQFNCSVP